MYTNADESFSHSRKGEKRISNSVVYLHNRTLINHFLKKIPRNQKLKQKTFTDSCKMDWYDFFYLEYLY